MPSSPFLWLLSPCPETPSLPYYQHLLCGQNPHTHLFAGLGYPRVQEQLYPAVVKPLGRRHSYENVPKRQAPLSPVYLRRTEFEVLLPFWAPFPLPLCLLQHPLPDPRVLGCFPSPTVPHGEESHAGKEHCSSGDTTEEPTAHGSQSDPYPTEAGQTLPVPPRDAVCSSRSLRRGRISQEQGLNRMWSRNRVGKDQEAKESADLKDPGEARGIFSTEGSVTQRGRDRLENTPRRRVWHSVPGGKRASLLPTERLSVPGWVLRGRRRRSEP